MKKFIFTLLFCLLLPFTAMAESNNITQSTDKKLDLIIDKLGLLESEYNVHFALGFDNKSVTNWRQRGLSVQTENKNRIFGVTITSTKPKMMSRTSSPVPPNDKYDIGVSGIVLDVPNIGTYTRETHSQDTSILVDYRRKYLNLEKPYGRFQLSSGIAYHYRHTRTQERHIVKLFDGSVKDSITNPVSGNKDQSNIDVGLLSAGYRGAKGTWWEGASLQASTYATIDAVLPIGLYSTIQIGISY